jgi:hypothetical protein
MTHRDALNHRDALSGRLEPDPRDPDPGCGGALAWVHRGEWDGVRWDVYACGGCGARIATVGGRRHWWNHVLTPAAAERLGEAAVRFGRGAAE